MILYRAMSLEEFRDSKYGFSFKSRFKWFSENVDFIENRVRDGKFNNSKFCNHRYDIICKFKIESGVEAFRRLNQNELMLDRRNVNKIKFSLIEFQLK